MMTSACVHAAGEPVEPAAVTANYADLAQAMYEDSLSAAQALKTAVDAFVAAPGEDTHAAAKQAWLAARVPYQQTEVYRFGNPLVDDWEGKVNAWPLDEGLIDYVDAGYGDQSDENDFYTANLIANPALEVGGKSIDAKVIDAALIQSLHEIDEVEANVATGYHVVEFLLWGQDLHGTAAGAGERPHTDFDPANCTGGNCERRAEYLQTATGLIIADLEEMAANWAEGGAARAAVTGDDPRDGLRAMLTGLGSLSYGELAGERMKLGLLLHDPEEEHDCFSDNTHNSHYYDILGMQNVVTGRYQRIDGSTVEGPSLLALLPADVAADLGARLESTLSAAAAMKTTADGGEMAYDQMIGEGNDAGNAMVQSVIDGLLEQTKAIEAAVAALDLGAIELEGSDSLDDPDAVFQ
ncbi:MAG: peptidase [Rhizobiales bacterium]|nr:peptidase [Hyphomicrobiales bacterium]